jgi:DNA-binding NarL/FixJ family response regulator
MQAEETSLPEGVIGSVLVIDDHPLYCDALASAIEGIFQIDDVQSVTCLSEGMKLLNARYAPDLILLDLNLPDVAGLNGFLRIKDKAPDVPVIVISASTSEKTIQALLGAGAAGFIPKDLPRKAFSDAVRTVCDGKVYAPPGIRRTGACREEDPSADDIYHRIEGLSPQQSRILNLICKGKANKQIAYELSLAEATVKAHITALLRRLGVRNRTQAALLVQEANLVSGLL